MISKRSITDSSGSELSLSGGRQRVPPEGEKSQTISGQKRLRGVNLTMPVCALVYGQMIRNVPILRIILDTPPPRVMYSCMTRRNTAHMIIGATLVGFAVMLTLVPNGKEKHVLHGQAAASRVLYDESGNRLESLFVGVPRSLEAKGSLLAEGALEGGTSRNCAPRSPNRGSLLDGVESSLSDWFSPLSAFASGHCSGSGCIGHWMYFEWRLCYTCGSTSDYAFYYSDPNRAQYYNGYRYVGGAYCNDCICAEVGCLH